MGFYYVKEKKNFELQWKSLRKQYEAAGMSQEAIQAMYEYDRSVFNRERAYLNHTQDIAMPSFDNTAESSSPLLKKYQDSISVTESYHETKSRFSWIGKIENEELLSALENLSDADLVTESYHETKSRFSWIGKIENEELLSALENLSDADLKLLTLYVYEGYTLTELSKVYRISFSWIGKIENEELLSALENLSDADLKLLTLYVYEGYTLTELSKVYRISSPAIYKRIRKIAASLKRTL